MKKPLHLGFVMQGGSGWAGGAEYIRNLILATLAAARKERREVKATLLAGQPLEPQWRAQFADHAEIIELPRFHHLLNRFFGMRRRSIVNTLRQLNLDFLFPFTYENHSTLGLDFPLKPTLGATRWAGWIPDFQHKHLPQFFDAPALALRDRGITDLCAEADTVVFSSEAAAADYRRFWPEAPARPYVLRFNTVPGADWFSEDPLAVQQRHGLPDRFFLVSNQFWQHKNHETLFAALGMLAAKGVNPQVVCTGQLEDYRSKDHVAGLRAMLDREGVKAQVHLLGLVPRLEQIQLMRRALAVIQPSLSEGWSTVVEDARLLGKPILLSDLAVHLEQAPPMARYFPPQSAAQLADLIEAAWRELTPGPDLAAESAAASDAKIAMESFGSRFLQLASGEPAS